MKTGQTIKELRLKNSMTQKDLADKVGTRENYISDIETGKRPAGENMLRKIAEVFNMSYLYLLVKSHEESDLKEDEQIYWNTKSN